MNSKLITCAAGIAVLLAAVLSSPAIGQTGGRITLPSQQIPSGTAITVKLLQTLSSANANVGDPVRVRVVGGASGLPDGTILVGQITHIHPATPKVAGVVDVIFGAPSDNGGGISDIASAHLKGTVATADQSKDVGIGAGAGALLGLVRKGKIGDALEGAGLGALGGYAVNQAQKHPAANLNLQRGSTLTLHLDRNLVLRTEIEAD